MREVKFRGVSTESGKFVYGFFAIEDCEFQILECRSTDVGYYLCPIPVIEKSVGQFTGLKDSEGVEIFEGAVVEAHNHENPSVFQIEFIEGGFCATHPKLLGYPTDINFFYPSNGCAIKVIGNIYENPELLEV